MSCLPKAAHDTPIESENGKCLTSLGKALSGARCADVQDYCRKPTNILRCMQLRYPERRVGEDLADEVGLTTVAGLGKNLF
jgi:hypothetical protein